MKTLGMAAPVGVRWFALVLYMAVLTWASVAPAESLHLTARTRARQSLNNLLHVPGYGFLAGLFVLALLGADRSTPRATVLGGSLAATYGALMEFAQVWVPGRTGSLSDCMLNIAGAIIGALAALAATRALRARRQVSAPHSGSQCSSDGGGS